MSEFSVSRAATPVTASISQAAPAQAVAEIHVEIDRAVARFAEATGVRCPPGCGQCCLSPNVETTVTDVSPLVDELMRSGRAETVLMQLMAEPEQRRCVLYQPHPDDPTRGRCSMYATRPSICRLFGFAGRRDADGVPQFSACRVHKQHQPEVVDRAAAAVRERSIALPIFADVSAQIRAVDPAGSQSLQPINDALREGLQRALLRSQLLLDCELDAAVDDSNDGNEFTPPSPRVPRRRRAA